MNGVIVITTKRGKQGAPIITYNGNFTLRTKPRYSQYNIMNSYDQMSVFSEMERKGLLGPDIVNSANSGVYGIMYNQINAYNASSGKFGLENTRQARHDFLMKYARPTPTGSTSCSPTTSCTSTRSASRPAPRSRAPTPRSASWATTAGASRTR